MKILLFLLFFCIKCTKEETQQLQDQIKNLDKKSESLDEKSNFLEKEITLLKKEFSQSKTQFIIMDNNKKNTNTNNFFKKVKCVTVFLLQAILLVILAWFLWQFILKSDTDSTKKSFC